MTSRQRLGLTVICVAMFVSAMDMTIVNVALPDISADLGATIGQLQWVMAGFLVSLAALLLVGNGLADRFGRRRVFVIGLAAFAVTSVLAAVSTTALELIAARVLMGAAAAGIMPPALSLLAVVFAPEERPRALGIWSAVAGAGLALGPVIGGLLVQLGGWPLVFLVNAPVTAVAAPLALRWLPESTRPDTPPLDVVGALLSTVSLAALVSALIEGVDLGWTSAFVLTAAAAGVFAGAAFVWWERRAPHPLFDVRVLARRAVAVGGAIIFATYVASLGLLFVLPQYLQYVEGRSSIGAGLIMLPFGLGLGVAAPFSGRLAARVGVRTELTAALLLGALGFVPLVLLGPATSVLLPIVGMALVGTGMGLVFPPATAVIMNDLGLERAGEAAATNQMARQVGGSFGVAIVGSVFAAVYSSHLHDSRLSATAQDTAENSIEGARQVAHTLPPADAARLLTDALTSFDRAAGAGMLVALGVMLAAAVAAWWGLPHAARHRRRAHVAEGVEHHAPAALG